MHAEFIRTRFQVESDTLAGCSLRVINYFHGLLGVFNHAALSSCPWVIKPSDPKVVNSLLDALKDPDSEVRGSAAHSIGRLKPSDPKAVNSLLEAIKDQISDVRGSAARALGDLKSSDATVTKSLINALRDKNPRVRERAVRTLEEIKSANPKPKDLESPSN
jgi:HEAT repeat protein